MMIIGLHGVQLLWWLLGGRVDYGSDKDITGQSVPGIVCLFILNWRANLLRTVRTPGESG